MVFKSQHKLDHINQSIEFFSLLCNSNIIFDLFCELFILKEYFFIIRMEGDLVVYLIVSCPELL